MHLHLKIVDDFIATRQNQLLDSQIVTFNLREAAVNRERLRDTTAKLWTFPEPEGAKTATEKNRQKRSKKKKKIFFYSPFPWVEKLNREGNKEAGFNRESPKISFKNMPPSDASE